VQRHACCVAAHAADEHRGEGVQERKADDVEAGDAVDRAALLRRPAVLARER
jgi:hypothetical protein